MTSNSFSFKFLVRALAFVLIGLIAGVPGRAQAQVKISQIYAGGGNAGAIYQHDYVELFNASAANVNIGGWTLAYTKADGRAWKSAVVIPDGTVLAPGRYYLVRGATNGVSGGFPALSPDLTSAINLSNDSGKLLLLGGGNVSALTGAPCPTAQQVIDFVGYGPRATCAEPQGTLPPSVAPSPGNANVLSRKSAGCQDGNNNSLDFLLTTSALRSLASPPRPCGGSYNLAITLTRTPEVVGTVPGDIVYSVTVANVGAASVGSVQVVGTFPAGTTLVSITGASGSLVGNTLTVPLGTMAAGIVAPMFRVTMRASAEFLPGSPFTATFTATPTAGDSDSSNNGAVITTVVRRAADAVPGINGPASCDLAVGSTVNFQLNVGNIGQLPASAVSAAVKFPAQSVLDGFGGAGAFAPSAGGGGGVWTIGTLAPGQVVSMSLGLEITGPGGMTLEVNASTTSLEVETTNNLDRFSQFVSSPDLPIAVLASSVIGSDSAIANVPGVPPGNARFSGQTYAFGRPFVSPNGQFWTLVADTNLPEANNSLLLVGQGTEYGVAVREGVSVLPGGGFPGAPFGVGEAVFGRVLAVGDDGRVAFSCKSTLGNGRMSVVRGAPSVPSTYPYTLTGVARTGQSATVFGQGVTYGASMSVNGLELDGGVAFTSILNGVPADINEAVFGDSGQIILMTKGDTATAPGAVGQTLQLDVLSRGNRGLSTYQSHDESVLLTAGSYRQVGSDAGNEWVRVNGANALITGLELPTFGVGVRDSVGLSYVSLEADGTYVATGTNDYLVPMVTNEAWVVRGQTVGDPVPLARTGQEIYPGAGERWDNKDLARTFFVACARGNDFVLGGLTDAAEYWRNGVLVHNSRRVLIREGDPLDLDNNGVNDDDAYVGYIAANRAAIDASRRLLCVVDVRRSAFVCTRNPNDLRGQALLLIQLPVDCRTDLNADGIIDADDIFVFLTIWFAGPPGTVCSAPPCPADWNGDGLISADDIFAYLNEWFASLGGCF